MATPESVPRYTPDLSDPWWLQATDRMRGYLAADPDTQGFFEGIIRSAYVTTAISRNPSGTILPPVVSLYSTIGYVQPHSTMGNGGAQGGTYRNTALCTLYFMLSQEAKADADYYVAELRFMWKAMTAFQTAVLKYQGDPNDPFLTPQPLWQYLQFPQFTVEGGGTPTISHARMKPEQSYEGVLSFTLTSHLYLPDR